MSVVRCCECNAKATKMVNNKYYCNDCKVPAKKPAKIMVEEINKIEPEIKPQEEPEPEKQGFWKRLYNWLDRYTANHSQGGYGPF